MLDTIKIMREAANLLNEECDRVEHGVVKGGDVPDVVRLEAPVNCDTCPIYKICMAVDESVLCKEAW